MFFYDIWLNYFSMRTSGKSLSRELGKNTGNWLSNKVFGDGHATPSKLIIQRQEKKAAKSKL